MFRDRAGGQIATDGRSGKNKRRSWAGQTRLERDSDDLFSEHLRGAHVAENSLMDRELEREDKEVVVSA